MRDVLTDLLACWQAGRPVGLATVVATSASAPRPPGAALLVEPSGETVGSVSGGCVEAAVYEAAMEVIVSGQARLERYGFADASPFAIGLTCGGTIEIFIRRVDRESFPDLLRVAEDAAAGRPVAVATMIEHPRPELIGRQLVVRPDDQFGSLTGDQLDDIIADDARELMANGRNFTLTYVGGEEQLASPVRIFVESFVPPPRMMVFGAIDFAAALAQAGAFLGYRVTVCDARPVFATAARFPAAEEVVVNWPHRYLAEEAAKGRLDTRTVVCVLTHDEKFDIPLLALALRMPDLAYIGAMGSRRTVADRLERLAAEGVTAAESSRLSSPIGLDLGAHTPEETAVSIVAEILAKLNNAHAGPLSRGSGPIHHRINESPDRRGRTSCQASSSAARPQGNRADAHGKSAAE